MIDTSLYSEIDYSDTKQVSILIKFYSELKSKNYGENYNETLGCILLDIEDALNNIDLTVHQRFALVDTLNELTEKEIAEKYGISRQMVAKYIKTVAAKASRYLIVKKNY